jgi:hypothetical protein
VIPHLEKLANSSWLLKEAEADQAGTSVPLHARGVRLDWLVGFLKEVGKVWQQTVHDDDEQRQPLSATGL